MLCNHLEYQAMLQFGIMVLNVVVASAVVVVVVVRVSKLDPNLATFACCEGFKYQHIKQPLNHCHCLLCNILHL